ncbi:hypothetical protein M407DRAFT_21800 [Tulasnella calospora MUT 4182]|uniref:Uncharacterized protein n=1 Tax=Tulasnella calospora MUT 4182 TaxID=1051891 RepID=A0A0C3L5H4_9AGAM|nr:hypothetical protein M407DRAFT_21800 [Tulasnella calospora MUT 4182]
MNSITPRPISIVQARADAFLQDIFDLCKSCEDPTTETLSSTIATEVAICDAAEVAIRRRRNERTSLTPTSSTPYSKSHWTWIGFMTATSPCVDSNTADVRVLGGEVCTRPVPQVRKHPYQRRGSRTHLEYETEGRRFSFKVPSEEEVPAFHNLVQKIQGSLKGPPVTNIRSIVADLQDTYRRSEPDNLLKAIGGDPDDLPGEPMTGIATDWPFKWLRAIEIHNALVKLDNFTRLVERYLPKISKPLLEEIDLVNCIQEGMKLTQAAERLVVVGIAL